MTVTTYQYYCVILRGSAEATKQAGSLIAAMIRDPEADIAQLLPPKPAKQPPPQPQLPQPKPPKQTPAKVTG